MSSLQCRIAAGLVALFLTQCALAQGTSRLILDNGSRTNRINIVFLSEGYRAEELEQFERDARAMLDVMLSSPPYNRFKRYFNAYAISVASNESGSDHPSRHIYRDTFFKSTYEFGGVARLIGLASDGYLILFDVLTAHVPDYDMVVLVVNDPEYGGSGGSFAVTSTNVASHEIVLHELGHSFAGLTDEYDTPLPTYHPVEMPNSTRQTSRDLIPWSAWIDAGTPLPTPATSPYESVVGLFEGSQYQSTGWYRPRLDCKMRTLNVPFCEVCAEAHVRTMYALVKPYDAPFPSETAVTLAQPGEFRLDLIEPVVTVNWQMDGVPALPSGDSFLVDPRTVGVGTHRLEAHISDNTKAVRNPIYLPLLQWKVAWDITIPRSTSGEPPPEWADRVSQNYPNPAGDYTSIGFTLSRPGKVSLRLFDMMGRLVAAQENDAQATGPGSLQLDLRQLAAGLYIYRFEANGYVESRRLVVLR